MESMSTAAVQRAMQESKDSYQRETELRHAREVQFLDDFKRAILLNSGHVASLGPEPVDEQLEICPGDPTGSKIRLLKAQPGGRGGGGRGDREGGSSRLLAMKAAFSMEDEEEDDEDDEWDPLQVLKDSPDEFEEDVMSPHHAGTGSPEQKWKPAATKTPPVPTSREEERAMLARAMRESREAAMSSSSSSRLHGSSSMTSGRDNRRKEIVSSGSMRHSNRGHLEEAEFEEADPAPRPGMRPLPPPAAPARGASRMTGPDRESSRSQLDEDRDRFLASIINRRNGPDQDAAVRRGGDDEVDSAGTQGSAGRGGRRAGRERQWV